MEYQNSAGQWVGVTTQWLSYGFARNYDQPPTHPYNTSTGTAPLCNNLPTYASSQCQNSVSPAILILQQLQQAKTAANAYGAAAANDYNYPSISTTPVKANRAILVPRGILARIAVRTAS